MGQKRAINREEIFDTIALFMCGDVMTGRGIDQILPHPGAPRIYESFMKSALGYVRLAEEVNGPIPKPVDFAYIWGDAMDELTWRAPDLRIINLETAVTTSEDYEDKGINYRMHPENIACIREAGIDCSSLANNHILDWGYPGLIETLETLENAGVKSAGAGRNLDDAESPAVMYVEGKGRVILFSFGSVTSGVPSYWAAFGDKPGVNLLKDLSGKTVSRIKEKIRGLKQRGDVAVASIHWGGNWGYEVTHEEREFAHNLIADAGIDVIHGHSSHHVKGIEVYRDKLILYGCGDFLNDYEGIAGYEYYRADLGFMYFASIAPSTGKVVSLQMVPTQVKHFKVNRASKSDALWLRDTLNREGEKFGTRAELGVDNVLALQWENQ